jgi:hypothetical protein
MKKTLSGKDIILAFNILLISICLTDCKKTENPIKFPLGTFPDTVVNLTDINSAYDDYNLAKGPGNSLYQLSSNLVLIFSSNRKSLGGQFDLEQANISFTFDQTTGIFGYGAAMSNDPFLDKLITKAETPGNDFGPYRLYSAIDGFEYLFLSSVNTAGNLDLFYFKNRPVFGSSLPDIFGPYPVKLLNTSFDDAYISFNSEADTAYFASNRDGNFDIFLHSKPVDMDIASWFDLDFAASTKVDSINSPNEDKCPLIFNNIMVFTSDRPGGLGGFDLYYSIFRNGAWSSPVNLGPRINTSSDEYRPIIGSIPGYTNFFMMFSSNRPGGKGGFDLYFTGIEIPQK